MNLAVIWQAIVSTVTSEVHRVEQAFVGTAGTGAQKKQEVLNTVQGVLSALAMVIPGLNTGFIVGAAGALIDAIVAVSNAVGYFQHGGQAPQSSHP